MNALYILFNQSKVKWGILKFFGKNYFTLIIYFLAGTNDYDLEVSHDLGKSWAKIHKHIYSFGVQGKFVYVSTYLSAEDEV